MGANIDFDYTLKLLTDNNSSDAFLCSSVDTNGNRLYFELDKSSLARTKTPRQMALENIKDVIFNDPATIVFWADGTKTVVKTQGDDKFDPEKGLAMAISKKYFGNYGFYCDVFKKFLGGK